MRRHGAGAAPARAAWADVLPRANEALQRYFGHRELRPFQREALEAWWTGRDVIAVLATGAGKSMCFQLPPLLCESGRWALVISPLVALMQDQVRTLLERGIPAGMCGSGATGDLAASWGKIVAGAFRVVYMTPEFALSRIDAFSALKGSLCVLAVDEAHCISSWGHDFRPQFRELGKLRAALSCVPTMCITATCRPEVRADIVRNMKLRPEVCCVAGTMNRANLRYAVKPRTTLASDLGELFDARPPGGRAHGPSERRGLTIDNAAVGPTSSCIIYVPTKKKSEEVASWLAERGVPAAAYHAGLGTAERLAAHLGFLSDEVQVVVATVAFGMGIDKPSIRRVIHYGAVQTLEHYVQQCGRAGRDGDEAECIAFMKPQDASEGRSLILRDFSNREDDGGKERCEKMLHLNAELNSFMADASQCRRVRLLGHFGESPTQWSTAGQAPKGECITTSGSCRPCCDFCDVCLRVGVGTKSQPGDFTEQCRVMLRCVDACEGQTGTGLPCQVAAGINDSKLRSKGLHNHRAFRSGGQHPLSWWKAFLPHVRQRGLLQERPKKLASGFAYLAIAVSKSGQTFLSDPEERFVLEAVPAELAIHTVAVSVPTPTRAGNGEVKIVRSCGFGPSSDVLYKMLFQRRLEWQRSKNVLNELIISNDALRAFAAVRPSTPDIAHRHVQGLPFSLSDDLLQKLLDETAQFCKTHVLKMDTSVTISDVPSVNRTTESRMFTACEPAVLHRSGGSSTTLKRPSPDMTGQSEDLRTSIGTGASADWLGKRAKTATSQDLDCFRFNGPSVSSAAFPASTELSLQPRAVELRAPEGGRNVAAHCAVASRREGGGPPECRAESGGPPQLPAPIGVVPPPQAATSSCLASSCGNPAPRFREFPLTGDVDLHWQPPALCTPAASPSAATTPAERPRQCRSLPWACASHSAAPTWSDSMPASETLSELMMAAEVLEAQAKERPEAAADAVTSCGNDPMPASDSDDELMMAAEVFEAQAKGRPTIAADATALCDSEPGETSVFSSDDQSILLMKEYNRIAKENAELRLRLATLTDERSAAQAPQHTSEAENQTVENFATAALPPTKAQTTDLVNNGHAVDVAREEDASRLIVRCRLASDCLQGMDESSVEFLHHTSSADARAGVEVLSEDERIVNLPALEPCPASRDTSQAEAYSGMTIESEEAGIARVSEIVRPCIGIVLQPVPMPQAEKALHRPISAAMRRCLEWPSDGLYKMLCQRRLEWQRANNRCNDSAMPNDVLRAFANLRPSSAEIATAHIPNVRGASSWVDGGLLQRLLEDTSAFCEAHRLGMDAVGRLQAAPSPADVREDEGAQPAGHAAAPLSAATGILPEGDPAYPARLPPSPPGGEAAARLPPSPLGGEDADWLMLLGD